MEQFNIDEKEWPKIKEKLKEEYPDLTDNDLSLRKGEEDMLVGRIQNRIYGLTKDRVVDKIMTMRDIFR